MKFFLSCTGLILRIKNNKKQCDPVLRTYLQLGDVMSSIKKKALTTAVGTVVLGSALATAQLQANPFSFEQMKAGYQLMKAEKGCGSQGCGGKTKDGCKEKDGGCGDKCGGKMDKSSEKSNGKVGGGGCGSRCGGGE